MCMKERVCSDIWRVTSSPNSDPVPILIRLATTSHPINLLRERLELAHRLADHRQLVHLQPIMPKQAVRPAEPKRLTAQEVHAIQLANIAEAASADAQMAYSNGSKSFMLGQVDPPLIAEYSYGHVKGGYIHYLQTFHRAVQEIRGAVRRQQAMAGQKRPYSMIS